MSENSIVCPYEYEKNNIKVSIRFCSVEIDISVHENHHLCDINYGKYDDGTSDNWKITKKFINRKRDEVSYGTIENLIDDIKKYGDGDFEDIIQIIKKHISTFEEF